MPYGEIPWVRDGRLFNGVNAEIVVDSPAWFAWLEEAQHFSYMSAHNSYRMTVRKEKRRHDLYWYAYLKDAGKLHNAYVGRSQDATEQRLEQTIQRLVTKSRRYRSANVSGK